MKRGNSVESRRRAAAALVVAAGFVATACGESAEPTPRCGPDGTHGAGHWELRDGNWQDIALVSVATAWTSQGWFFYGGFAEWDSPNCEGAPYTCRGGALYHPDSDTWTLIDPPPFEEDFMGEIGTFGRLDASATWDGSDRVIVWGGEQSTGTDEPITRAYADGAVYHLSTETWDYLPVQNGMLGRAWWHQALWIGDGCSSHLGSMIAGQT